MLLGLDRILPFVLWLLAQVVFPYFLAASAAQRVCVPSAADARSAAAAAAVLWPD